MTPPRPDLAALLARWVDDAFWDALPDHEHAQALAKLQDETRAALDAARREGSPEQWEAPDWCFYCNRRVATAETHELHCPRCAPRTPPAASTECTCGGNSDQEGAEEHGGHVDWCPARTPGGPR